MFGLIRLQSFYFLFAFFYLKQEGDDEEEDK